MRLILVSLALISALTIYIVWIRPTIRNLPHIKDALDQADTFWSKVLVWFRVQWDAVVGFLLIMLPEVPDLIQQLTELDLSAFIPSDTAKTITAILGVISLAARAFVLRKTS